MKTVALLAREPGVRVLEDLLSNPGIELHQVYTHGRLPKAEGGGERAEVKSFRNLFDVTLVDSPDYPWPQEKVDLILCLSWRYMLPISFLSTAKHAVNIHRGELPRYKGAEPVRRALEDGQRFIAITAHRMTEELDSGEKLADIWTEAPRRPEGRPFLEHVEIVKKSLYPFYTPLLRKTIWWLACEKE